MPRAFGAEGPRAGVERMAKGQSALTRIKIHIQDNKLAIGFVLLEKVMRRALKEEQNTE